MLLMIIPGVISMASGLLFLIAPTRLCAQSRPRSGKWWVDVDAFLGRHPMAAGISLIALGLFYLSSAYYVWLRLHS